MVLIVMNFVGAGVQETFQKMLSLAVVLQLMPFLYMFARAGEIGVEHVSRTGTLQQDDVDAGRHQRTGDDDAGNRAGIFPGAADQFAVVV